MTDAAQGAAEDPLAAPAGEMSVSLGQAALTGLRQPIVAILLLIALFTTISGKPLDGFLMLTVATLLVWDAARSRLADSAGNSTIRTAGAWAPPAPAHPGAGQGQPRGTARSSKRRVGLVLAWLTAGLLYADVVGSFKRYSWPATASVVALGCLMVAVGWQGPVRLRNALTGRPLRRAWLWAVVLVTGGLWELTSLLQQPHLTTDSYAHPTISALTDPLLASHPGRSVALGAWLLIGWFLVGR